MGARLEAAADGSSSRVARAAGDGVRTALVTVGKGGPQATSRRAPPKMRHARTRPLKPTLGFRRRGLRQAVQMMTNGHLVERPALLVSSQVGVVWGSPEEIACMHAKTSGLHAGRISAYA